MRSADVIPREQEAGKTRKRRMIQQLGKAAGRVQGGFEARRLDGLAVPPLPRWRRIFAVPQAVAMQFR